MKKRVFAIVAVMALAFVMCSCGSDDSSDIEAAENTVQMHQQTEDEQKIMKILTAESGNVALVDYNVTENCNCATVGYDVFQKGKPVRKNRDQLTGGITEESKTGMIGLSFGDKGGVITFYGNDGSAASATADAPWKNDKGYTGEATAELAEPVSVEPGKKIYIFVHQAHKGDEMVTVTPGDVQNDPEALKSTDKVYAFYVILKNSKEYEQ